MSKLSRKAKKLRVRKERVREKLASKLVITRDNAKLEFEINQLKRAQQEPVERLTSLRHEQSSNQND